jgi:hypothetical protein
MPFLINYKENSSIKEKYSKMGITSDIKTWLAAHSWKIRKLGLELDGKPLAELIRLDEKLLVVINEETKKMLVFKNHRFLRPENKAFENQRFSMPSNISCSGQRKLHFLRRQN